MAKKSRSKSKFSFLGGLVALVLGVAALALFVFLPMVKNVIADGSLFGEKIKAVAYYSGFGMIFGGTITPVYEGSHSGSSTLPAISDAGVNAMALIVFIISVVAVIGLCSTILLKKNLQKPVALLSSALLVVAGIMMFMVKGSAAEVIEINAESLSLGLGAILGGIVSILAGLVGCASNLLK